MTLSSLWQKTKSAVTSPEGRHTLEQAVLAGGLMFALAASRAINNPHHWVDANKQYANAAINAVITLASVALLKPLAVAAEAGAITVVNGTRNWWQNRSHFRGTPHTVAAGERTHLNPGTAAADEQRGPAPGV